MELDGLMAAWDATAGARCWDGRGMSEWWLMGGGMGDARPGMRRRDVKRREGSRAHQRGSNGPRDKLSDARIARSPEKKRIWQLQRLRSPVSLIAPGSFLSAPGLRVPGSAVRARMQILLNRRAQSVCCGEAQRRRLRRGSRGENAEGRREQAAG